MLGKNNNKEENGKRRDGVLNTIIGPGTFIKGEVQVDSNIRIDGKFEGTLKAEDTLIVGTTGELLAEIHVKNATVGGKIEGNLVASNSVVLERNSELKGDLKTKGLIINEGAVLNGNCIMNESGASVERRIPETPVKESGEEIAAH